MSLIELRRYIYLRGMIPEIEAWWPVAVEAIFQIKARVIMKRVLASIIFAQSPLNSWRLASNAMN